MKKDIAYSVAYCDICNKVRAEYQKPADFSNHCPCHNGNGMMSVWISSQDYPGPDEAIMRSRS